jgi:hypothetical protein
MNGMYKFELTEPQVALILSGLAKLPLEQSFDLFAALRNAVIQKQESKEVARPMGELFDEEENKIGMTD